MPELTASGVAAFRRLVRREAGRAGRDLPWRRTADPWAILVSEFMLQQTGVARVEKKYRAFLDRFPDPASLASAPLDRVLEVWQGLGYNRRAINLRESARRIVAEHEGRVPEDRTALLALPGVGPSTAGGVLAFAFNRPTVFIETNIRRVFIQHFFPGSDPVPDRDLLPLIERTLDRRDPRGWYAALMDYGSRLGSEQGWQGDPNRRSAHYTRQSPFAGSDRQLRGEILRHLIGKGTLPSASLAGVTGAGSDRIEGILDGLESEGFIVRDGERVALSD